MKQKFVVYVLLISMAITLFGIPKVIYAGEFFYVDGYRFDVIEKNGEEVKIVTTLESGDKLYATQNLADGSITLEEQVYASHVFGIGIGSSETTEFNVEVDTLNNKEVDATIENTETGETIEINKQLDVVTAQMAETAGSILGVALGINPITAILIAIGIIALIAASLAAYEWAVPYARAATSKATSEKKYFMAKLKGGKVEINKERPIDLAGAIVYLSVSGSNSIYTKYAGDAQVACKMVSPIKKTTPYEIDSRNNWRVGYDYYYHYHPLKNSSVRLDSNHCWYGNRYGL